MDNLKKCINNDLANNYGNLCQRVFSFIKKNCQNKIPVGNKLNPEDIKFLDNLRNKVTNLVELMDNQKLNEFVKEVVNFSFEANKYFNDSEPWSLKDKDKNRMNAILFTICEQIKNISILLHSIIPISTGKVLEAMNIDKDKIKIEDISRSNCFNHSAELRNLDILFKKIENDN